MSFDDKKYTSTDEITSLTYGHYKINQIYNEQGNTDLWQ